MIQKIWLRNYGPFADAELTLQPLTVIVGPNASGKSIALQALHRLRTRSRHYVGSLLKPMRKFDSRSEDVEIGIKTSDHGEVSWTLSESRQDPKVAIPKTELLKLQPDVLRQASYLDTAIPHLRPDGYGLATVLADMKLSDHQGFESILNRTRTIIPTFEGIRFRRSQVENHEQSVIGNELVFDMRSAPDLPPTAVSDGTMLTLGLLTLLFASQKRPEDEQRPALFLIDELERGLHPKALGDLIAQLRLLTQETKVQILATSHSPYLVDWLKPEEVRITSLLEDGSATIRELGEHPEFDRWKEEMKPGEFWSTVGEDWN